MVERTVKKTVRGNIRGEGHGAKVRRTVGTNAVKNLDPFLLLDQMVECELPNGFPDHAHRYDRMLSVCVCVCLSVCLSNGP